MRRFQEFWIATGLFIIFFGWGWVFTTNTLPFEGPDEQVHYCYAASIAQAQALPIPFPHNPLLYSGTQPPLYYIFGAVLLNNLPVTICYEPRINPSVVFDNSTAIDDNHNIFSLTDADEQSADVVGLRRIRLLSVGLGALTVVFIFFIARLISANNHLWATALALLVGGLPPFTWMSSVFNNDNLAILMGTVLTYAGMRELRSGTQNQSAIGLGLLAGIGLMSKFNLGLYIPALGVVLLWNAIRARQVKAGLIHLGLFLSMVMSCSAWWFIRNALLVPEHGWLGPFKWLGPIRWASRPSLEILFSLERNQLTGLWARYGYQVPLPRWVELGGLGLSGVALFGLVMLGLKRNRRDAWPGLGWVSLVASLTLASGLYAVWLSADSGQGRFIYPGIASLAVLFAIGWTQLWPVAQRPALAIIGSAISVVFALSSFLGVYQLAYRPPRLDVLPVVTADETLVPARFRDVVELVGATVTPTHALPGEAVQVTACWKPLKADGDLIETATMLDAGMQRIASRVTLPGLGRYRTADWQLGRVFCDELTFSIPPDTPRQGHYPIAVGWLGQSEATLPNGQAVNPLIIGDVTIPSSLTLPPPEASLLNAPFEDSISLIGYTVSYTPTATELTANVHIFWQTKTALTESYHVFVHWFDAAGQLLAQSDGTPGANHYPTHKWLPGEIVDDVFQLTTAAPISAQPTHFAVGLYRWPSGQRLAVTGPFAKDNTAVFPAPP